jgi:tetratricopeptide (TPR) repeat protein
MLELPAVTLCCVDTVNHALALRALERSVSEARFARSLLLTDALPPGIAVPAHVEIVAIPPIASREAYSQFVLKSLLPHVATTHLLLIQWDGYVINASAWDPRFLGCDYLGAKWHWAPPGMRVGNGGFSLRSRRLLEALQDPRIAAAEAEDIAICRTHRQLLESEHAIRFGDEDAADRFAFEAAHPIGRPFGFHGLFNFCRVVPVAELAALAPAFSDAIASSIQLAQLLRNCAALAQWPAVAAIARRMLALGGDHAEARRLLEQAESTLARGPSAGRNDPGPCGSGKRFKHCHGAVGGPASARPAAPASPSAPPPPSADALVAHAMSAHQAGDLAAAERGYRAALRMAPEHPHALHYLGVILYQQHRLPEAFPLLQRAVERIPHEPEFHNNLGLALLAADRVEEAIASHRRAIELAPGHVVAWNNLGLAFQARNDVAAAIDAFRHALDLDPRFAEAHWNLGLALLSLRHDHEGWREYEWRLVVNEFALNRRALPGLRWDGTDPRGKTLLLVSEQGLGDSLQFLRFARTLAARGARVVAQIQPELTRLAASVEGIAGVVGTGDSPSQCDGHVPLLSLPYLLGVTDADLESRVPYIAALPERRRAIAAALPRKAGVRRIGLAWAGNPQQRNNRRRSMPFAHLAPLFALPGIDWYSLQKGEAASAIATLPQAHVLRPLPAGYDFDDTAALVAELDLVISVCTSMAHLAGALARPVWVMLGYAADWRWFLGRTDSLWYPTARLFRQPRAGDWDAVVAAIGAALAAGAREQE